jgi:murein DD-endopeptidase MepM/ murein hydrolase activator NlpD
LTADTTAIPEPRLEYGLPADSFDIHRGYIPEGSTLSSLLSSLGLSPDLILKIASGPDSVFNVRKIRAGNTYAMFFSRDSSHSPCFFIYEMNITDYVMVDIRDTVKMERQRKEITVLNRKIAGTITSSLWNAMTDQAVSPQLALDLSDIFAWTIDFFGVEKGDSFRVIFSELYVDTVFAGIGKIEAGWFKNAGKEYFAIPFIQDDIENYYHIDGQNLKRAFLKAPLSFSRISSKFSNARYHPVLKYYRPHHGVDYAAPKGTPVYTIGDGTVIYVGWSGGGGKTVKVRHNSVYSTTYMHLSGYAKGLSEGKKVKQGELIGYVGSTGLSTGPHLDFRVYKNGQPVNPLTIEAPPCEPVKKSDMKLFKQIADSLAAELKRVR